MDRLTKHCTTLDSLRKGLDGQGSKQDDKDAAAVSQLETDHQKTQLHLSIQQMKRHRPVLDHRERLQGFCFDKKHFLRTAYSNHIMSSLIGSLGNRTL